MESLKCKAKFALVQRTYNFTRAFLESELSVVIIDKLRDIVNLSTREFLFLESIKPSLCAVSVLIFLLYFWKGTKTIHNSFKVSQLRAHRIFNYRSIIFPELFVHICIKVIIAGNFEFFSIMIDISERIGAV